MSVVDIPVGSLDNESDLMDWLANELVTNHHFTEKRRLGTVGANDLQVVLQRDQADTFHNEAPFLLALDKGNHVENIATITGFQFNVAPDTYENLFETTTPASVTVTFDHTTDPQTVQVTAGAFSSWVTAGYTTGEYVRITNAATAGNNGLYKIEGFTTTSTTDDTLEIRLVANGGIKDLVASDVADVITVVEELEGDDNIRTTSAGGFFNGESTEVSIWNIGVSQMESTAPYVRARFISNPTSNNASPSEPLNFIVVVEVDANIYRKFSFGEVVKLLPFDGGHYLSGDIYNPAATIDSQQNASPWCQGYNASTTGESSNGGGAPGGVYSSDYTGAGRGWLTFGSGGNVIGAPGSHYHAAIYPHFRGSGVEIVGYSPSPFSGQSERWPLTIFGTFNTVNYNSAQSQHAPMAVIPDIFLADITNVDAYSVFEDTFGERFMVVPMYTKAGSGVGSSEKWGYLIRNPDLVVT